MDQTEKKSLNFGTIIFFIIALLQVPNIINLIKAMSFVGFGIGQILVLAIFVITILFAISLSSNKNAKTYALILFLLYALEFVLGLIRNLQMMGSIFNIALLIVNLLNVLCYVYIFLFYKKTGGNDKEPIKSVLVISFIGMLLAVVGNGILYVSGYSFFKVFLVLLDAAAPFIFLWVFSARNVRVPISESKGAIKKAVICVVVPIVSIAIFCMAVGGVFEGNEKQYNAEEADTNNDGSVSGQEFQDLVNEYMDDHGY